MLRAVLLDVNGTLTDPAAVGEVFQRPELGDRVLAGAVHTAAVQAMLGLDPDPLSEHLRAALEATVAEEGLDPERVPVALQAAAGLPARFGAADALAALGDAGLTVVALTNSGAAAGRATLQGCGLIDVVDDVLGVDAVASFKPDPAVYRYALDELGESADRVALLATHPWDLAGGAHAGMVTAWVRHGVRPWPRVFAEPDVQGDTLLEVAAALAAMAG